MKNRAMSTPRAMACVAAMLLTGCYPTLSTRYQPHGTGKAYGPYGCQVNDHALMEFALGDGATFNVSASMATPSDPVTWVGARLILLPLQHARFEAAELKIKTDSMSEYISMPITRVDITYNGSSPDGTKPGMATIDPRETLDGGPVGSRGIKRMTNLDFSVKAPFQGSPNFTVIFPTIVLDARTITLEPVRFTLLRHARAVGVACL